MTRSLSLAALLLLSAPTALAEPPVAAPVPTAAAFALPMPLVTPRAAGLVAAPWSFPAMPAASLHQARAQAPGLGWLGVVGSGMQFRVRRQGAGLDLRGGAYLQLLGNVALSGVYRVFDYDAEPGDSSLETDYRGPLVGLSLSF